ncbi:unnamed protein product [Mytilus coruscus]|uniref:Uncharacterized protein n=1 Tax=Mytilus coruscus TaxID=42192 RepID=A0A6J8DAG9_MYTCO|nr:unnamed protein product [Mytilus coruscus]
MMKVCHIRDIDTSIKWKEDKDQYLLKGKQLTKDYLKLSLKNCGTFEANNRTEEDIKLVEDSNCQLNSDINEEIKKLSEFIIDRVDNRGPGDCCESSIEINGEMLVYGADIKYERLQSTKSFLNVYVNKINKDNKKLYENIDEGKENRVIDSLSDDLLEKVAKELLFESHNSCFCPGVIGIFCCGTKIIFLYCEITPSHWKSAVEKKNPSGDGYHSTIHFTKAYDYMSAEDRNEIIPYLFWLGYVQSSKYKIFDIS